MPAQLWHVPTDPRSANAHVASKAAFVFFIILVLTLWTCVPQAVSQDHPTSRDLAHMSLQDLMNIQVDTVYAASKFEQKVTEAPSSVTIITADEIQKYGYRTVADVLQSVPGFYVTTDRNYSYVGMDGISRPTDYNTHLLILIDGHRVNDAIFDGAYVGTEAILDVDLIERVEIIRGPGSSLYGTNAFLGVINIVTKRGRDIKGLELSTDAGSLQTYRGRVTYGQQHPHGLEFLISGTGYDSKGNTALFYPEFNTPATDNGIARDVDSDRFGSAFLGATYRDFTFRSGYVAREKHIPTASFGTVFNDPRGKTTDARAFADLQYRQSFRSKWDINLRGFYDWYKYDGIFVYDYAGTGLAPFTLNDDYERGNWLGFDASVSRHLAKRHHLTVGSEETFNINLILGNYDQQPYFLYLYDRHSSSRASVYAEDEITIRKDVLLSAGVRYDRYSTFGGTANPRLGLILMPSKTTDIKLLYGKAFRAPDDYELNYTDPSAGFAPNPNLRPEKIQSAEVVFEKYVKQYTSLSAAGFYHDIDHLISRAYDPMRGLLYFANLEDVRGKGLELQFSEKRPSGWEGRVSYTVQSAHSSLTGSDFSNSPKHLAKVNLIVPMLQKKLFLGLEGQEVSRRETVKDTRLGGFFVSNATLSSKELLGGLQLSATLYNAFNKRYEDAVGQELRQNGISEDGRAFRFKITYRFNLGSESTH